MKIGIDAGGTLIKIVQEFENKRKYHTELTINIDKVIQWLNQIKFESLSLTGGQASIIAEQLSKPTQNFVEFDRFWRELKTADLKQQYLSTIDIDSYRKIFEYPFEPVLLFDVLQTLSQLSNYSFVFEILDEAITKMPRFDLSFSFLSPKESESKAVTYFFLLNFLNFYFYL